MIAPPTDAQVAAMSDAERERYYAGALSAASAEAEFFAHPPYHDLSDEEIIYGVRTWAGEDLWSGRYLDDHSRADLKLCDEYPRSGVGPTVSGSTGSFARAA